jgi:drug/metabolite transporter (DMT)-like permease
VLDLGMIYMVLARGPVILIAPIAALGASIPVAFGLAGGDPVSATILAGLALALLGSVAASYEPEDGAESAGFAATVPLALAAAVGVGLAMLLLERASEVDPLWGTGALRVGGFIGALAVVGVAAARRRPAARIASLEPELLASLVLVGLFDVLADIGYAVATTSGSLSTVAVLASMYPVVTVALGYTVLRERVFPIQVAGVGLALAGVALLAAPAA